MYTQVVSYSQLIKYSNNFIIFSSSIIDEMHIAFQVPKLANTETFLIMHCEK